MAGNKLLYANKDDPRSYLSSWALPPETSRDNCHGQTSGERGFLVAWAWSTCVPAAVYVLHRPMANCPLLGSSQASSKSPVRSEQAQSKDDTGGRGGGPEEVL